MTVESAAGGVTSARLAMAVDPTAPVNAFAAVVASCTAESSSRPPSGDLGRGTRIVARGVRPGPSPFPAVDRPPCHDAIRKGVAGREISAQRDRDDREDDVIELHAGRVLDRARVL